MHACTFCLVFIVITVTCIRHVRRNVSCSTKAVCGFVLCRPTMAQMASRIDIFLKENEGVLLTVSSDSDTPQRTLRLRGSDSPGLQSI